MWMPQQMVEPERDPLLPASRRVEPLPLAPQRARIQWETLFFSRFTLSPHSRLREEERPGSGASFCCVGPAGSEVGSSSPHPAASTPFHHPRLSLAAAN